MTTHLQPYAFHGHTLRIEADTDGAPLFHVGDLCAMLDYQNPRDALRRHVDPDDVVKRDAVDTLGRTKPDSNWVREPGMWSLLLGSHAPNAMAVKRWVTREVLPQIRQTGRYDGAPAFGAITGPLTLAEKGARLAVLEGALEALRDVPVILTGEECRLLGVTPARLATAQARERAHRAVDVIIQMEADGRPRDEICAATGKTQNNVRQVVFQARKEGLLPPLQDDAMGGAV